MPTGELTVPVEGQKAPAELLLSCSLGEQELEVEWNPEPLRYPPDMEALAEEFWCQACASRAEDALLFDGPLCALQHFCLDNGRLLLSLSKTTYRYVLLAEKRAEEIVRRWGEHHLPRVLGVSAVVLTTDGVLPLMVRSNTVGEYPGRSDVFGGHIDPEVDLRAGRPDPFVAMRNELQEELKLRPHHIASLRLIGLIKSCCNQKPELVFTCQVNRSYRALRRSALRQPHAAEFAAIFGLADEAVALGNFLKTRTADLSPSAYGSLWLYGMQRGFFSHAGAKNC